MSAVRISHPVTGAEGSPYPADRKRLSNAASEFQALLMGQLLKGAREGASMTSLDGSSDATSSDSTAMEFAEQQLSSVLASSDVLGLSKLIVSGLAQRDQDQALQ